MTLNARLRDQLLHIESLLRQHQHWQETAPHDSAFASDQPFFMDTLEPLEWLQWVLIPRMHQLLDNEMERAERFCHRTVL